MSIYDSSKPNKVGSALMKRAFDRYGRDVYTKILEKTDDREVARELTVQVFTDLYSGMQKGKTTDAMELLLNEYTDKRLKWFVYSEKDVSDIKADISEDDFGVFANKDAEEVLKKTEAQAVPEKNEDADEPEEIFLDDDEKEQVLKRSHSRTEKNGRKGNGGLLALIIVLAAIGGWLIVGYLVRADIIHNLDLGYSWFNSNVFPLF